MPAISVMARIRPVGGGADRAAGEDSARCVEVDAAEGAVVFDAEGAGRDVFGLDSVFGENSTQQEVYAAVSPCVEAAMEGFNSTVFAYGQTGSGKTHTLQGTPEQPGVVLQAIGALSQTGRGLRVSMQVTEVYCERIRDLLDPAKDNLPIKEGANGVYIEGATEVPVSGRESMEAVFHHGLNNRKVAGTLMNAESSRSHCVFTFGVQDTARGTQGKLVLVDLAGSEKVDKTGAAGQALEEAKQINKSLSALGNTINALAEGSPYIPFRESKLTRLLQSSLGGNSMTCMIVCMSPSDFNAPETLSTLRFGRRAKRIESTALSTVAIQASAEELKLQLQASQRECERLRKELAELAPSPRLASAPPAPSEGPSVRSRQALLYDNLWKYLWMLAWVQGGSWILGEDIFCRGSRV